MKKPIIGAILVLLCFSISFLPACSAKISSTAVFNEIQNIELKWLVNEPNYKEVIVNVTVGEKELVFHINITLVKDVSETYLNLTTFAPDIGVVWVTSRFPDTLGGAPYTSRCTTVEAFRLDIPSWLVDILIGIAIVIIAGVIVAFAYAIASCILEKLGEEAIISPALSSFIFKFGTILLSLPWIFITIATTERNPDGSLTLYFPYMKTGGSDFDYAQELVNMGEYAIATNISWWRVVKHTIFWGSIIWFTAEWSGLVYSPEEWCKPPDVIPQPWYKESSIIYLPSASFINWPNKPTPNENITFVSTSFSPNGTIESVHWCFGDGMEADGFNVTHSYTRAGNYNVTITVVDSWNSTRTFSQIVSIILPTIIDIIPDTMNLKGIGKWVTAYIEFPEGYNVQDINVSTIMLNETIPVDLTAPHEMGDYDNDALPDLMVNFNRTQLINYIVSIGIEYGNVTLTVSGRLYDGTPFEGNVIIKISSLFGDVNCDGIVNISDLVAVAKSYRSRENEPNWNPNANFAYPWDKIDLCDLVTVATQYGKTYT